MTTASWFSFDPISATLTLAIALAPLVMALFKRGYYVRNLGALKKSAKRIDEMQFWVRVRMEDGANAPEAAHQAAATSVYKPQKVNILLPNKQDVAEALDVAVAALPFVQSRLTWKFVVPAVIAALVALLVGFDIPALKGNEALNYLTSSVFTYLPGVDRIDLAPGALAFALSVRTAFSKSDEWKFMRVFAALADSYYEEFVSPAVTALAKKWKEEAADPPANP